VIGLRTEQIVFDTAFDDAIVPSTQKSMIPLLLGLSRRVDSFKYPKLSKKRITELTQGHVEMDPLVGNVLRRFRGATQMYDRIMALNEGFETRIAIIDLEFNPVSNLINEIGLVITDRVGVMLLEEYLIVERDQSASSRSKSLDCLVKYHFGQGHIVGAHLIPNYFSMVDKYVDIWMSYDKSSDFTVLARNGITLHRPVMDCQLLVNIFGVFRGRQVKLSTAADFFGIRYFHEHNGGNDACVAANVYKCTMSTVRGEKFNKQQGMSLIASGNVTIELQ